MRTLRSGQTDVETWLCWGVFPFFSVRKDTVFVSNGSRSQWVNKIGSVCRRGVAGCQGQARCVQVGCWLERTAPVCQTPQEAVSDILQKERCADACVAAFILYFTFCPYKTGPHQSLYVSYSNVVNLR